MPPDPGNARALLPGGQGAREVEVLRLVAAGWTNDRIAAQLFLRPRTVQTQLTTVYRTLNVANRAEAVRAALEVGLA